MRILDIDLDFFLSDISEGSRRTPRLHEDEYIPWQQTEVTAFLECNLGLKKEKPIPGKFFTYHHELLRELKELTDVHLSPFQIVHIDAHADMGMDYAADSLSYILKDILNTNIEERIYQPRIREKLNEGNWLVFAVAFRWVQEITYVFHPKLNISQGPDFADDIICKNSDVDSGVIQLPIMKPYSEGGYTRQNDQHITGYEPEVPISLICGNKYKNTLPFDRIYLTHSPQYTPESSDLLIPCIREYIKETL